MSAEDAADRYEGYEPFDSEQFRRDFFFRRRDGLLNWKQVVSVDLESVVRNVDINALQDNIEHITFADLRAEEFEKVNSMTLIQLFRLMQLMVEYLLNVQNYFMAADVSKDTYIAKLTTKLKVYKQGIKRKDEKAAFLKKELKSAKLLLKAYSKTSGGFGTRVRTDQGDVHQCSQCSSSFVNSETLQSHLQRRHPGAAPKAEAQAEAEAPVAGTRDIDFSQFGMGDDPQESPVDEAHSSKPVPQQQHGSSAGTRGVDVGQVRGGNSSLAELKQDIAESKRENEAALHDQLSRFESNIKHMIESANSQNQANFVSSAGPLHDEDEDEKKVDAHKKALDANNAVLSEIQEELARLREENAKLRQAKDEVTNLYEPIIDERRQKEEEARLERLGQLLPEKEKQFTPFTDMPYLKSRFALPATRLKELQGGLVSFVEQADANSYTQLQYDIDKLGMRREESRIADELDFLVHEFYRPSQKLKERLQDIADIERAIAERKAKKQGRLVGTSSEFRVPPRGALTGKLTVTVVKGVDLVNRDIGEQDPYCILSVGKEKFQTVVHERGGKNPVWSQTFVFNVAVEEIEKEMLKLRVYDSDVGMDDSIGRSDIPISQMLTEQGRRLHTIFDGSNFKHSNGQIELITLFERDESFFNDEGVEKLEQPPMGPINGTLTLSVLRGVALKDRELVGQQDPYCIVSTKTEKFKTRVHENGGKNPVWNQAFVFNVDTKEASKSGVKIVSFDKDSTLDDEIGRVTLSFTRLLSNLGTNMYLLGTKDKPAGQLELNVKWTPHPPTRGKLVVSVNAGHKLTDREFVGKQDPYCLLQLGEQKFKTSVCQDGGKEPVWENESFEFYIDVKDAEKALLQLSCYDRDTTTDDLIGKTKVSLANLIANPGHRGLLLGTHTKNNGVIDVNVTWLGEGQSAKSVGDAKRILPEEPAEGKGLDYDDDGAENEGYDESKLSPEPFNDLKQSAQPPQEFGMGKLLLQIIRGIELAPRDGNDPQDPYCIAAVRWKEGGKSMKEEFKTTVHEDGAAAPSWEHRNVFNLSAEAIKNGAVLKIDCWDEDVGGDDLIGTTGELLLSEVLSTRQGQGEWKLHTDNEDKQEVAGCLVLGLRFYEEGTFYQGEGHSTTPLQGGGKALDGFLYVTAKSGVELTNREWRGKEDPYCIIKVGKEKHQTFVHHKGGVNPVWNQSFVFRLDCKNADHVKFKLSAWDHDSTTDDEIGHVEMTVTELLQAHLGNSQIVLGTSKRNDGKVAFNIQYHARNDDVLASAPATVLVATAGTRDVHLEDFVDESDEEDWPLGDDAPARKQPSQQPAKPAIAQEETEVMAFKDFDSGDDSDDFLSKRPVATQPPASSSSSSLPSKQPPPSSSTFSSSRTTQPPVRIAIEDISSDEEADEFYDLPPETRAESKQASAPTAADSSFDSHSHSFVESDDFI